VKTDQLIVLSHLPLGILFGYVSNYLNKSFSSLLLAVLVPLAVYIVSQFVLMKFIKGKKKSWVVSNSFVPFIFVWLIVWILLHNI
jgi:hypothetical protein